MTGAFYGVAAGMTMPVVVANVAGPGGFGVVLTVLTVVAGIGTVLLGRAVTTSDILTP
ncbi:MAG: hypothetical protein M3349_03335 [Actinomycetota bacterium]|nr:hypothetical protein [Actinomycetota bacterium]